MHEDDVPTAGETYVLAWGRLWERFPELLLMALLWILCTAPGAMLHHAGARGAAALYNVLVTVPLNFGALYVYLRAARDERLHPAHLFEAFRTAYFYTA